MIISHNKKFIYIAIPKTGSVSIHNAFLQHPEVDESTDIYTHMRKVNEDSKLDDLADRRRVLYFSKHDSSIKIKEKIEYRNKYLDYDEYFKFAFVRNPWDRVVSWYGYTKRLSEDNPRSSAGLSMEDFIKKNEHVWVGRSTQYSWIFDDCGNSMIDFIGRFERLQEDFDIICDKIGITKQKLLHKNKSKRKHYTEYYNEETINIVAKKFAKDIECFGYKFGE